MTKTFTAAETPGPIEMVSNEIVLHPIEAVEDEPVKGDTIAYVDENNFISIQTLLADRFNNVNGGTDYMLSPSNKWYPKEDCYRVKRKVIPTIVC